MTNATDQMNLTEHCALRLVIALSGKSLIVIIQLQYLLAKKRRAQEVSHQTAKRQNEHDDTLAPTSPIQETSTLNRFSNLATEDTETTELDETNPAKLGKQKYDFPQTQKT